MNDITESCRTRVNGEMVSQFQGKPVCVLGEIVSVENNGKSFKLKASDGNVVVVQMNEPVQELLEGFVEVQGIVSQYNTILCRHYIKFPKENAENFDMNMYNEAVQLISRYPNHYMTA